MKDINGNEIHIGSVVVTGRSGGSVSLGFGIVTSMGEKMVTLTRLPPKDPRKSVYHGSRRYGYDVVVL